MRRLAAVAACLVLVSGCGAESPPAPSERPRLVVPPSPSATPSTPARVDVAVPVRIRIPSIGVDARIIKVGLLANGAMQTPPSREKPTDPLLAGWYKSSRRPGADGPSVIVGHVDGKRGADVFANLHKLKAGQKVTILDAKKQPVTFKVKRLERTPKDDVDWNRILRTKGSSLWLFTCGGTFNASTGHYRDNIIIESVRA
jgi:LPXTG-site transpeptidase (sortase) family protein